MAYDPGPRDEHQKFLQSILKVIDEEIQTRIEAELPRIVRESVAKCVFHVTSEWDPVRRAQELRIIVDLRPPKAEAAP